jgi:hypothetical protein
MQLILAYMFLFLRKISDWTRADFYSEVMSWDTKMYPVRFLPLIDSLFDAFITQSCNTS